ncbi:hypothetical protein CTheo_86 [Ceratobasidium theobromae]|uniref:Tumor susceptibility protein n=1 Tax=Ceratobasidium theobromae TaxID=1582974 RepID=A0A5N5QXX5_9AGAM|nr:hypothetical protein CTheo_86 [Ceratobasidium theobromae]
MALSLTQKWLKQVLAPYPQRDQIYIDVDSTLATYSTLKPKNDVYTFNDGRAQLLLCVHGLIPIMFRQATYNIPVAIWIPLEYPRLPPLVYVVPTSDMLVKPSKHVDPSGECSFEYMDNWRRKSEGCSLKSLVEVMQECFSRDPPVYAKPKNAVPPPTIRASSAEPQTNRPPPPRPPPPPSTSFQSTPTQQEPLRISTPPQAGSSNASPPPRPPKVYSTQIPATPPSTTGLPTSPMRPLTLPASPFPNQPPLRAQFPPNQHAPPPPPPPPPIPGLQHHQHSHNRSNSLGPPVTSSSHLSTPPAPPNINNRFSLPPRPSTSSEMPHVPQPPPLPPAAYQQHLNPIPVPLAAPAPTPIINIPAPPAPRPNLLDEDDIAAQAAEAPPSPEAPPRPMNPELLRLHHDLHAKITAELGAFSNALGADTERLRATQADLLAGEPAIRDEMARLEAVRSVCVAVGNRLSDVVTRAEANVQSLKSKGDPEVDELVCSTAIVYNQLVDLIAEDKAIEDTIYHLHRALNSGRIDLDRFIRTVRILAQEQFMKRALIEKINEGLPIGARFQV